MRKTVAVGLLLLASTSLSGCHSITDFASDARPFGGTALCLDSMKHTANADFAERNVVLAAQACDLPLSVVADTVLLPLTVSFTLNHHFIPRPDASEQQNNGAGIVRGPLPTPPAPLPAP